MPNPVSPVVPGLEPFEIVIGGKGYRELPVLRGRRPYYTVMSRYKLTDDERKMIASGADIYLSQMTFGHLFHPQMLVVAKADDLGAVHDVVNEQFGYSDELAERLRTL